MSLSIDQKERIKTTLKTVLRNKFNNYNPEPAVMPFHTRLLGKDRLALYSFIHSLSTNFGTTVFEPVAVKLANKRFIVAKTQVSAGNLISETAQFEIQKIMDNLTAANIEPNKINEIETLRKVSTVGKMREVKPTKVDLYLNDSNGKIYLIDFKTAKPNKGGFKEFKRTLLEWTAVYLAKNKDADVSTLIAIPYNPYEPKPYSRWTMAGMLDLKEELKVAKELWDFIGGQGAYEDLLKCFEEVGIEMRQEIDDYFQNFAKKS